jgi:hypothetical protein
MMSTMREGNAADHYVLEMLSTLDKILDIIRDLEASGHDPLPYVHDTVVPYVDMDDMERAWIRRDYDGVKRRHAEGWSTHAVEVTGLVPQFKVSEYVDGTALDEVSSYL